jgi:5-methylcytosine-specific restriction enzyme subunit McrC
MFEHDKVTQDDPRFTFTPGELIQIERFNERMRRREGLKRKVLDVSLNAHGEASIRSSSYVGVMRIGKRTIQILPKIAKKGSEGDNRHEAIFSSAVHNLLFMLSFTKRLRIKEVDLSRLSRVDDDFFEFLIYLFAKNTLELLKRNMCKEYVDLEENVVFLKGKIKFSSHIKHNAALKHRFYTEFDDFSADNLLNQILKYTTHLLLGACSSPDNVKKLQEIYFMLDDVSLRAIIPELFSKVKLTRLNDEYVPVLNLCKLFIERAALELRAGPLDVFSFVFDMDVLFEEFIGEFIKRKFAGKFYEITLKRPVKHFAQKYVEQGKPENVLPLKPDIVIRKTRDERTLIVDTKYKELTSKDKKEGADRSDIYQMYAYSKKYSSPDVIMLYPQFREQRKVSDFDVRDGTTIHIRTVNVCRDLKNDRNDLYEELQEILSCTS